MSIARSAVEDHPAGRRARADRRGRRPQRALRSACRWWLFATAQRTRLAETLLDWLHSRGLPDGVRVPDDLVAAWGDHLRDQGVRHLAVPPSFAEHRSRILLWIVYWPFSLVWTTVHDVVVEVSRWLMLRLRKLYLAIARWVYRDVPGSLVPESHPNDPRAPWSTGALDEGREGPGASASARVP